MMNMNFQLDPKFMAGVELIGRTGARDFRIGYSDEADGQPTVWYAVARWPQGANAAGALDPVTALIRLCELTVDGGKCTHCHQVTIFDSTPGGDDHILDALGCVYRFDPELATFRRTCEGVSP